MRLLTQIEALVDALTSLVNEERVRHLKQDNSLQQPFRRAPPDFYGPHGIQIHFDHKDHQG